MIRRLTRSQKQEIDNSFDPKALYAGPDWGAARRSVRRQRRLARRAQRSQPNLNALFSSREVNQVQQ